jgi:hypothetical protein
MLAHITARGQNTWDTEDCHKINASEDGTNKEENEGCDCAAMAFMMQGEATSTNDAAAWNTWMEAKLKRAHEEDTGIRR